MIGKSDILKMAHKVTKRSQGISERKVMHPHREWFIGVFLFLVVAIAGGVLNAQSHVRYGNIQSEVVVTSVPVEQYRADVATEVVRIYTEKQSAFDVIASDVPPVSVQSASSTASSTDTTNEEITSEVDVVIESESESEPESISPDDSVE